MAEEQPPKPAQEAMISHEDAKKVLQANVKNIIKKTLDGKVLSPQESHQIVKASRRNNELSYHGPLWLEMEALYMTGVNPGKLAEIYGIAKNTITSRAKNDRWTQKRDELYDEILETAKDAIKTHYQKRTDLFFEEEYQDFLTARRRLNKEMNNIPEGDLYPLLKCIKARIDIHNLGRRVLNLKSEIAPEEESSKPLDMVQAILKLKELVDTKQFDPRTIDIDALSKAEISED